MFPGAQFWKTARKVYVAKKSEVTNLRRKSRGSKTDLNIIEEIRRMIDPPGNQSLDSHARAQSTTSSTSTTSSATVPSAKDTAAEIMRCTICLSTAQFPAASCSACYAFIGCVPCTEQWINSSLSISKCPLCRTTSMYNVVPVIRGIMDLLGQRMPPISAATNVDTGPAVNSGPDSNDDDDDDDEDLLRPVFG